MRLLAMAFFFALNSMSSAFAATETVPKLFVICTLGSAVRTVQVNESRGYFETLYSKEGATKVIGSGKSYESCVGFLNNVRTNLGKSGWDCKEKEQVSVTKETEPEVKTE